MDDVSGLVPKAEANYRIDAEGTPCSSCANFLKPNACSIVEGEISETGTCDFFTAPDVDAMLFGGSNG